MSEDGHDRLDALIAVALLEGHYSEHVEPATEPPSEMLLDMADQLGVEPELIVDELIRKLAEYKDDLGYSGLAMSATEIGKRAEILIAACLASMPDPQKPYEMDSTILDAFALQTVDMTALDMRGLAMSAIAQAAMMTASFHADAESLQQVAANIIELSGRQL